MEPVPQCCEEERDLDIRGNGADVMWGPDGGAAVIVKGRGGTRAERAGLERGGKIGDKGRNLEKKS